MNKKSKPSRGAKVTLNMLPSVGKPDPAAAVPLLHALLRDQVLREKYRSVAAEDEQKKKNSRDQK